MKLGLFYTNKRQDYNRIAASHWIRILQMIPIYKKIGIDISFNNLFKRYDAIILFRKSKKKYYYFALLLKLISKKVYFDTCINIFELNEEINSEKQKYACKIGRTCDGFICASHQIADYASIHVHSTYIMEDTINLKYFKYIKKEINFESPVYGWSGIPHKAVFLNSYSSYINNRIILISKDSIKQVPLDFKYQLIKWQYETFPKELLNCDIALLPRPVNDSYNNCHSSFKALVFAVSGIPIIANKIPSYVKMAKYYNGILFLEDYNNDLNDCINELKKRSLDTTKVREYYSCEHQALMLKEYLEKQTGVL